MDDILTGSLIPGAVTSLIEETKDYCFLVTPLFKSWVLLDRVLEKAAKKGKRIVFIFGAQEKIPAELLNLNYRFGFDLYFVRNLNARLYLNEQKVLLSSMNLSESPKERSFEVGYVLQGAPLAKRFKEKIIDNDILSIKPAQVFEGRYIEYLKSKEDEARRDGQDKRTIQERQRSRGWVMENTGHCIRCGGRLEYNPSRPLCVSCYRRWSQFENADYEENFCHSCGKEFATSFNLPLCPECYRERG